MAFATIVLLADVENLNYAGIDASPVIKVNDADGQLKVSLKVLEEKVGHNPDNYGLIFDEYPEDVYLIKRSQKNGRIIVTNKTISLPPRPAENHHIEYTETRVGDATNITAVFDKDDRVLFITFDKFINLVSNVYYNKVLPLYESDRYAASGTIHVMYHLIDNSTDTSMYRSYVATTPADFQQQLSELYDSLHQASTSGITNDVDMIKGYETLDELYDEYKNDKVFRRVINSRINISKQHKLSLDDYIALDNVQEAFSKTILNVARRQKTVEKAREYLVSKLANEHAEVNEIDLDEAMTIADQELPPIYVTKRDDDAIHSSSIVLRAITNLNRVVFDASVETWGSAANFSTVSLDLSRVYFKIFPRPGVTVGAPKKLTDTIIVNDTHVDIIDPIRAIPKKKLGMYNCFFECLRHITKDDKEFDARNKKYGSPGSETYHVNINNRILKKFAKMYEMNIIVYNLDRCSNNILEVAYEYNGGYRKTINLGLIEDHCVIVKGIQAHHSDTDQVIAYYDIESVQDNQTNRQVAFMVGYKIGTLKASVYEDICKNVQPSDRYLAVLNVLQQTPIHVFNGADCIHQLYNQIIKDSQIYGKRINIFGFNSTGYDNYFVAEYLSDKQQHKPIINLLKNRLYVTSLHATFNDIAPLLPPSSLYNHCNNFGLIVKKRKGDVGFNYLNNLYNHVFGRDLDCFIEYLRVIDSSLPNPYDNSVQSIYDTITTYNHFDLFATEELAINLKTNVDNIFRKVLDNASLGHITSNYLSFDTLGQASMALFSALHNPSSQKTLSRKNKKNLYEYQAIIPQDIMREYMSMRRAVIASISYAREKFDSTRDPHERPDGASTDYATVDVVSLYPTVMMMDHKFGYGLVSKTDPKTLDLSNPGAWKKGIYYALLKPNDIGNRMRRIPHKVDANYATLIGVDPVDGRPLLGYYSGSTTTHVYQWHHNEYIYRPLYQQDIAHYVNSGQGSVVMVSCCYTFEKEASAREIFGGYITPFMEEKNRQDLLKNQKSPDYNPGMREVCKAFMNILSGKMVQIYDYDDETLITSDKMDDTPIASIGNFNIYKRVKLNPYSCTLGDETDEYLKKFGGIDEYYDYSLVGAQIYTYSREFMHANIIDECYNLGYEPLIIETDSLTTNASFFKKHSESRPTYSIFGRQVDLYYDDLSKDAKVFGQLETEINGITRIMTYGKKSYFMKYGHGSSKFRFKGVSKSGSILLTSDEDQTFIDDYSHFESMPRGEIKRMFRKVCGNDSTDYVTWARDMAMKYYYSLLSQSSLENASNQEEFFEKLVNGQRVTILKPALKKNIATISSTKDYRVCISGYIAQKSFNTTDKKPFNVYRFLDKLDDFADIQHTLTETE